MNRETTRGARRVLGWLVMLWMLALTAPAQATRTMTSILTNAQGTVVAKMDAAGNVTYTAAYRPYGKQQTGTPQAEPGYTGHVNDPDTGLVYMQARYYDPVSGRFAGIDSVSPTMGDIYNFNRYAYANNNPIKNVDKNGRFPGPPEEEIIEVRPDGRIESYSDLVSRDLKYSTGSNLLKEIKSFDPDYKRPVIIGPSGSPYYDDITVARMEKDLKWYRDNACTDPSAWRRGASPGAPKSFIDPTNSPQNPPSIPPDGGTVRINPPNVVYEDGHWVLTDRDGNPIDPSTGKQPGSVSRPEARSKTHVPLPADWWFK